MSSQRQSSRGPISQRELYYHIRGLPVLQLLCSIRDGLAGNRDAAFRGAFLINEVRGVIKALEFTELETPADITLRDYERYHPVIFCSLMDLAFRALRRYDVVPLTDLP